MKKKTLDALLNFRACIEGNISELQSFDGFDMLQTVSDDMTRKGRLLSLFQPDKATKHYFDLASPILTGKATTWTKIRLVIKIAWKLPTKRRRNRFLKSLITNKYGVCTGMANGNTGSETALTDWLSDLIDMISGVEKGQHLTFYNLHHAKPPAGCEHLLSDGSPSIDFRAVTTCLTFGRPFEFPLKTHELAFDAGEWGDYFPASVMEQLVESAKSVPNADHLKKDGKLPLPTLHLPIIIAARMSLSFPVLFSAVPLYAINHNKKDQPLERVLFSDGGITSNFPVHRFDSIYPRWPTLAINFKGTDEDGKPLRKKLQGNGKFTYMNPDRKEGVVDIWSTLFKRGEPQSSFFAFAFSIFRSAQNWHDNAFLRLPGFRDRVAEVWLKPSEGGLNLNMEATTVERLTTLGHEAGRQLVDRYATLDPTHEMSWNGHKWTRFRSGIEGLIETLEKFGKSVGHDNFDESDLAAFFASNNAPPCFQFDDDSTREEARRLTVRLYELAQELDTLITFEKGPQPPTEFGSRAPI